MKYTVTSAVATKVTIKITRRELWNNYMEVWRDLAWEEEPTTKELDQVRSVLCSPGPLDFLKLRALFRAGHTVCLLGNAMEHIDVPMNQNVLAEVIVVDESGPGPVTIRHQDIAY